MLVKTWLLSLLIYGLSLGLVSGVAWAAPLHSFTDDFSGNLSQWQLVNGSWTWWEIREQALFATLQQSRKLGTIVPTDAAWQGMAEYQVDFIFKVFNTTDKNFVVGLRDASNFYDVHFYNNQLIVEDIRAGLSVKTVLLPLVLQLNHDYRVRLKYTRLGWQLWMDEALVFATDESWPAVRYGGKFGLKISTGSVAYSAAYFDEIHVQELDTGRIHFRQTDLPWAGQLYDHADNWSDVPTVARFGCAVTAMSMLLRQHGFWFLADGRPLHPGTLNAWLQTQADGFVADGLVNWLAITRLTSELSDLSDGVLPKLEFTYFVGATATARLDTLRQHLEQAGPQLATDGGHFFLVDAFDEERADFSLREPLYDQQWLQQKPLSIQSLRLFVPSHTDLSYLLVVLPREVQATLTDEWGRELAVEVVEEEIWPPAGGELEDEEITDKGELTDVTEEVREVVAPGTAWRLIYYRQPASGLYQLFLSHSDLTHLDLSQVQLFTYQAGGATEMTNLAELLEEEEVVWSEVKQLLLRVNYQRDEEATFALELLAKDENDHIQEQLSASTLAINAAFAAGRLSFYLYYQLTRLINYLRQVPADLFLLEHWRDFHDVPPLDQL